MSYIIIGELSVAIDFDLNLVPQELLRKNESVEYDHDYPPPPKGI